MQTVDEKTVEDVINYARQASVRDDNNRLPPIKTFYSLNKMAVRIAGGDVSVTIQVWHTEIPAFAGKLYDSTGALDDALQNYSG
ncbi:MAG TPA: hypothetical protein PK728_12905 [Bacillota bacterium]|nr:hypothetical protein [Bacillota bacterium]